MVEKRQQSKQFLYHLIVYGGLVKWILIRGRWRRISISKLYVMVE